MDSKSPDEAAGKSLRILAVSSGIREEESGHCSSFLGSVRDQVDETY